MFDGLKVAIIATSHAVMGEGAELEPTGVWLEELTTPYYSLTDKGFEVDVFSIQGGAIPIDPRSVEPKGENDASVERYFGDASTIESFASTLSIDSVNLEDYDVIFLPGGHGTMFDYPKSETLSTLVSQALESNVVVAAVCHGPAGLVNARYSDGTAVVKGKKVAGFTNTEEEAVELVDAVPFLLETRLRELGANYVSGPDFEPFAVRDGLLITAQNPASAALMTDLIVDGLKETQNVKPNN